MPGRIDVQTNHPRPTRESVKRAHLLEHVVCLDRQRRQLFRARAIDKEQVVQCLVVLLDQLARCLQRVRAANGPPAEVVWSTWLNAPDLAVLHSSQILWIYCEQYRVVQERAVEPVDGPGELKCGGGGANLAAGTA